MLHFNTHCLLELTSTDWVNLCSPVDSVDDVLLNFTLKHRYSQLVTEATRGSKILDVLLINKQLSICDVSVLSHLVVVTTRRKCLKCLQNCQLRAVSQQTIASDAGLLAIMELCGGVRQRIDSVPVFCGSPLRPMEISVFWPKNREGLTDLDELWPSYRGDPRA